jgi:hypothetical protein
VRIVSELPPTIVHTRAQIAGVLQGLRYAAGMTCEDLDYHAGFSDRYVSKMEHGDKPQGRQGFHISPGKIGITAMAETWLDALGVRLVLVTREKAEEIGAVPCATGVRERPSTSWRRQHAAAKN